MFPPLPPATGCPLCTADDLVHIGVQASNLADTVAKVPLGPRRALRRRRADSRLEHRGWLVNDHAM